MNTSHNFLKMIIEAEGSGMQTPLIEGAHVPSFNGGRKEILLREKSKRDPSAPTANPMGPFRKYIKSCTMLS